MVSQSTNPPRGAPNSKDMKTARSCRGEEQQRSTVTKNMWQLSDTRLPSLLPSKSLVKKREHLGNVELDIFQVQVVLVVLLHLQKIVELEIQLEEATVPPWL